MSASGEHRLTVECPACLGESRLPPCSLCHGAGVLPLTEAVAWQLARGRLPLRREEDDDPPFKPKELVELEARGFKRENR